MIIISIKISKFSFNLPLNVYIPWRYYTRVHGVSVPIPTGISGITVCRPRVSPGIYLWTAFKLCPRVLNPKKLFPRAGTYDM